MLDINPDCIVETRDMFVNADTLPQLLDIPVDFVVDAIDALNPKCCLMKRFMNADTFYFVNGGGIKNRSLVYQMRNVECQQNCGLAKFIRKRLRKRGLEISRINCVYSDEQVCLPRNGFGL